MKIFFFLSFTISLLLGVVTVSPNGNAVLLGILEDVPASYAGQSDTRAVRVVFQKSGADWLAFPSDCRDLACLKQLPSEYPDQATWTITFNGRTLGRLSARTRKTFDFYSFAGLQDIVTGESVPTIGQKSEKYGGFAGAAVYRPLVATSEPFSGDPQDWKRSQLPPEVASKVRQAFRRKFPHVTNCSNPNENIARQWKYRDDDVRLTRVYGSRYEWFLAQAILEPYRCDGPLDDAFVDQWFVIAPDKEIRWLGKTMWLVDAGDYGNDGKSELVFSIDGDDLGGYELFYDDFKKHATFEFAYH
jgi:hypothetical protein